MRDQPTPEQTPERVAEKHAGTCVFWDDQSAGGCDCGLAQRQNLREWVETTIDVFVGPLGVEANDEAIDTLTRVVECRAQEIAKAQLDALTATLAHLTERAQDALKAEDRVRKQADSLENLRDQLFLAEARAEQAEATLARVKALCSGEPVTDGGLPADGVIYPGDPAHCDVCAALVDPLVSSSTEQTTKGK